MDLYDLYVAKRCLEETRRIYESDEFKRKMEIIKAKHQKKKEQRKAGLGK